MYVIDFFAQVLQASCLLYGPIISTRELSITFTGNIKLHIFIIGLHKSPKLFFFSHIHNTMAQ